MTSFQWLSNQSITSTSRKIIINKLMSQNCSSLGPQSKFLAKTVSAVKIKFAGEFRTKVLLQSTGKDLV